MTSGPVSGVAVTIVADQLRQRPTSGIATYTRGLLLGLRAMGEDAPAVTLAASRAPVRGRSDPSSPASTGSLARPSTGADPLAAWGWPVRASRLPGPVLARAWDRGWAGGILRNGPLVHATSLATAFPRRVPVSVMVHDVAWREAPETFPARGRRWHERALRRCIEHAALVITPSERTAALVQDAGMPGGRITVIAEGCDHLPPADAVEAEAVLAGIGVRGPYLLTVSTLEPRKNLPRLMAAYDRVRPRLPEPWPLVVVGPRGWGDSVSPPAGVKLAGTVSDAALAALYAGARCVAYVPLVEGWGLPPIEAMAACTPVVASPLPSTGGAALEVDPLDVDAIGAALLAASGEEATRSALVTAGLLRARELTWERAARDHTHAWERLL